MRIINSKVCLLFLLIAFLLQGQSNKLFCQQLPQRVGNWDNVCGFDINPEETYLVLSLRTNDQKKLYESYFDGYNWSEPAPIEIINNYKGGTYDIGGPFLYYDSNLLFFHANYPCSKGGYDIYYSEKTSDGWNKPVNMGEPINSIEDELYPSITPGKQLFYFSKGNPEADADKPRHSPNCNILYSTHKDISGNWVLPTPLHDVINIACEYNIIVHKDGKTVYLASIDQDNHKDCYDLYFARKLSGGEWMVPSTIPNATSEETNINPRVVDNKIYFLRKTHRRRSSSGYIYKAELSEKLMPLKTIDKKGKIVDLENKEPINTKLTVFDPTTLNVLGEFYTDTQTGAYKTPLLDGNNYIVDVRKQGYSFASFQLDYRQNIKKYGPEIIRLFNKAELNISVYDSEIFRPLEADVWVKTLSDNNKRIDAIEVLPGIYNLTLPIGHNYEVNATAYGFDDNSFEFSLFGDIIFSRFERNLPLNPRTKLFDIYISDKETHEQVEAEIIFKNLTRDETFTVSTSLVPAEESTEALTDPSIQKKALEETDEVTGLDETTGLDFKNPVKPFRFALIIGNEDYSSYQVGLQSESNVDYAIRDAKAFREYAINVLGVPEDNILFHTNARVVEMHNELDKIVNIIRLMNGNAEVFVYFAGHGFPDEQTNEPHIMPVDVTGSNLRFAIKLNDLYNMLTKHPAKRVTVFLDACFSGGARNVGLVSARGVRVRPRENILDGNLVVFSASSDRQSAHPYREKEHGIFTYFILEKLKKTKGNLSYKEFADFIIQTVGIRSVIINNQEQTPQVNVSPYIDETWEEWSFN